MTHRIEKVNSLFQREISELLRCDINDPRLSSFLAVTSVVTSGDLRHARVFVSCICEPEKRQEILDALSAASGFIRNGIMHRIRLRRIPEFTFVWDESIEHGSHIIELIDKVCPETPADKK